MRALLNLYAQYKVDKVREKRIGEKKNNNNNNILSLKPCTENACNLRCTQWYRDGNDDDDDDEKNIQNGKKKKEREREEKKCAADKATVIGSVVQYRRAAEKSVMRHNSIYI